MTDDRQGLLREALHRALDDRYGTDLDQAYPADEVHELIDVVAVAQVPAQEERTYRTPPSYALPAQEEGLDVERLARALFAVHPLLYPQSWPDDDPDEIGPDPREDADAITAEYARLSEAPP